jgi:hypothetical protein
VIQRVTNSKNAYYLLFYDLAATLKRSQLLYTILDLRQTPLAVLEGFCEVVGFDDVGAVEVGYGAG